MFKTVLLAISLLMNGIGLYVVFNPARSSGPGMTCAEARDERANKAATMAFAEANGKSLGKTHDFLRNSDFVLRNISIADGRTRFIYTANGYPIRCGSLIPGLDGSIVRVVTELDHDPSIVDVQ